LRITTDVESDGDLELLKVKLYFLPMSIKRAWVSSAKDEAKLSKTRLQIRVTFFMGWM